MTFDDVTFTDEAPAESTDLACEVCGAPIAYSGKGRKPKYCDEHKRSSGSSSTGASTVRRSTKDVESACATMEQMYDLLYFGLGMVSEAAPQIWLMKRERLAAQNRALFVADPTLCRRINSLAAKGGTGAFIGAHAMALFPVAVAVSAEVNARGAARRARAEEKRAAAAAANAPDEGFGPGAAYMP